jgi:putative sugar O-methyltransferase
MSVDKVQTQIRSGKQWTNIAERLGKQEFDLGNFRRSRDFFMFSTFDPERFGLIYLRTLIWTLYRTMDADTRAVLNGIPNRRFGNPHSILVDGEYVDLDYVVSAFETRFILDVARKVSSVVEIGAGYGRTCHSMLSSIAGIEHYWILDLPLMLDISRQYLAHVLPAKLLERIRFIDVTMPDAISAVKLVPDQTLAINIDSLAEMDLATVRGYLEFVDKNTTYFYSNNTVGKYRPADVGEQLVREKDAQDAIRSGPLPNAIDIFDIDNVFERFDSYRNAYLPGGKWRVLAEADSPCYPHYRQVIYRR